MQGAKVPGWGTKIPPLPRHDQKVRKTTAGAGVGVMPFGVYPSIWPKEVSVSVHPAPKTCQYASQLLRTSNTVRHVQGALASKDAALGSAPSFENPSCVSQTAGTTFRDSLTAPLFVTWGSKRRPRSLPPWASLLRQNWAPSTRKGPVHTACTHRASSHSLGAWHPQLSPRTHCVCDMSKRGARPQVPGEQAASHQPGSRLR